MKKLIAIIIVVLMILFLFTKRCGFENNGTPKITEYHADRVYYNYYKKGSYDYFINYYIYDENVECFCDNQCFMTLKRTLSITRDDICEHCGQKWKWHYNKD